MINTNKKLLTFIIIPLFLLLLIPSSSAAVHNSIQAPAVPVPPSIVITSHISGEGQELYLPENSSGIEMYPLWNISIYQAQSYSISVDGKVLYTGQGPISLSENMSTYSSLDMNISVGKTTYSYHNIRIIGIPPKEAIYSVSISSVYPGQNQHLTVSPGQTGVLMYPDWTVHMLAANNVTYSIYVNGVEVSTASFVGSLNVPLKISGNTTSVIVQLGSHIYNFKNENIARVPLKKYYAPPTPPLIFDMYQYERGIAMAVLASFLSLFVSMINVRKYIREKEATKASLIWRP